MKRTKPAACVGCELRRIGAIGVRRVTLLAHVDFKVRQFEITLFHGVAAISDATPVFTRITVKPATLRFHLALALHA